MISFQSIGHAYAFALQKIHAGLQAVEKVIPAVQKDATIVEGITALIHGAPNYSCCPEVHRRIA